MQAVLNFLNRLNMWRIIEMHGFISGLNDGMHYAMTEGIPSIGRHI